MAHGGKRLGAGKKLGTKWPSTLEREEAKQLYRQAVIARLQSLVNLQVESSLGQFARTLVAELTDSGLRLRKVTDEAELEALCAEGKGYRVALIEPDQAMSRYLTDQAIGRPDAPATTTTVSTAAGTVIVRHEHFGS